jgi:alkylhydroperoxidase/carboxymuconolactone decarboxylase family protein YurZ
LTVIAVLTTLGADNLATDVPAGTRHGLTWSEIEAAITLLALYVGIPRAVLAMSTARSAVANLDCVIP